MKKLMMSACFALITSMCSYTSVMAEPAAQETAAPTEQAQPQAPSALNPSSISSLGTSAVVAAQAQAASSEKSVADNTKPETTAPAAVQEKQSAPEEKPSMQVLDGKVLDASTKKPLEGAIVTVGETAVHTGADGVFHVQGEGNKLMLRAPGYRSQAIAIAELKKPLEIALTPFQVRGLYLSDYGISSKKLRDAAIATMQRNKMNTMVIDFKGDRGFIPFKVDIPLADEIGAQKLVLIKDMPALIADLKQQNIYLIARIVVFKDDMLAGGKPEYGLKRNGEVFRDNEHLRWVDPFRKEVWNYNVDIAKAAAKLGFDEVQFDYVRCPDKKGIVFSQPSNEDTRTQAVTGFLTTAHKALVPYNVMVSADIFGYVPWNTDDTGIGQKIDHALNAVDIVSPMLYPSGFQFGIPNYRNPVQHPYEIVLLSLKRAQDRTNASTLRFRPWLQAFRDYAFHGGDFAEDRMRTQIKAANDFGASGYLFWNPRNVYPEGKFIN